MPQVIFTDPEVAAAGMSADQAREGGLNVRVLDYDIGKVAGAGLYADDYEGCARMVVDNARNVVVGMTLVGPAVGEMIHAATIAVAGEVPIDRLWHAVPAFPVNQRSLAGLTRSVRGRTDLPNLATPSEQILW